MSLAGCTTDGASTGSVAVTVAKADTKIQTGLTAACPKLEAAHSAFVIAGFFFTVPANVTAIADDAYAAAEVFCKDPDSVTVSSAPAKVLDAIEKIQQAHDTAS